jgi:DNA-binding XRE family transcriptional regulator
VDASRERHARSELAKARLRRGLSQEEAAEAVGVSPTTWSRWECGEQTLRPVYRARIAEVFKSDPVTVERWLEATVRTETTLSPITGFGDVNGVVTVESFECLWRCDVDPARRHLLAAMPFVPAALGEWLSATYDPPATPNGREGSGPSVGRIDVDRVNEARQAFSVMDHRFGSGLVRPAIVDYLNSTVAPLLRGRYDDRAGAGLMTAAAGMTWMAGWTAFDMNHHGQAQHYYGQALTLAKAANDATTTAWILTTLSHQALHLGQPPWAVRLARAATDIARRGDAPPRVMALLLTREAWARAALVRPATTGDHHSDKQIEALLADAEEAYGKGPSERDPDWISRYDSPQLDAESGICWDLLGRYDRSVALSEHGVRAFVDRRPRSAQLNRLNMATAYLGMGELEQSLECARATVPEAKRLASTRLIGRIRKFDKKLEPYAQTIKVREFRSHLTDQLAA